MKHRRPVFWSGIVIALLLESAAAQSPVLTYPPPEQVVPLSTSCSTARAAIPLLRMR